MRTVELRVLCEGETEQTFVVKVLRPYLEPFRVFATSQSLMPVGFGTVPFERLHKSIKTEVGRSRDHQYVTTMIDLYGLREFPASERIPGETPLARVQRIEDAMRQSLPSPLFIPYIQLHEFEALVFADLDLLPTQFPDGEADAAPARLREGIGTLGPEDVDDGPDSSPSKRLMKSVLGYDALKAVAGPEIAARIGVPRLRASCPHFGAWVGRLERLAG